MPSTKCWKTSARRVKWDGCSLLVLLLVTSLPSQETTLRTQSNVVLVPTLVRDSQGEIVYGLQAKDFVIEDDGMEQEVRLDEQPESHPVSLVIAIQTGRRAGYEFARMRGLATILEPLVDEGHAKVAVVEFDSHIHHVHDFTGSTERIAHDFQDLQPGDGGAAIVDAIASSIKLLENAPSERQRMLLLISETRDHGSHAAKTDDVVAEIGKSNSVVYTLTFSPSLSNILDTGRGTSKGEMHNGVDFLDLASRARRTIRKNTPKTVAALTGGEYELFTTQKSFDNKLLAWTNHIHNRYLLSIAPRNTRPGLHQIRVRLREGGNSTVLSRTTYWAEGAS